MEILTNNFIYEPAAKKENIEAQNKGFTFLLVL